ncbi:hypothetical protein NL676_001664 [Syzygium grande]|nr:hypothetical protein NL676_001664 [Syzygium grande]
MCLSASSSDQSPIDVDADVPLSVQTLLAEYDDLFAEPTGLLPARDVDHRIPLKTGTEGINVRGFLGLTGYYRRFIRHYATLATPLTDLLTKDGFAWCAQAEHAFNSPKEALSHAPVLVLPDFSIPFVVETDASGVGIGAVLMQSEHPLAFYSRKLSLIMHSKSTYVREHTFDTILSREYDLDTLRAELLLNQRTKSIIDDLQRAPDSQPGGLTHQVCSVTVALVLAGGLLPCALPFFLRSFVHDQPSKWSKILSWAEYHYNTTFRLLRLRANLSKAQAVMKAQADKHRIDISFKPSDMVLLRLHPYCQLSARKDSAHKLGLRYYGAGISTDAGRGNINGRRLVCLNSFGLGLSGHIVSGSPSTTVVVPAVEAKTTSSAIDDDDLEVAAEASPASVNTKS